MTGNKLYFLCVCVFLLLVFLYQYHTPKKFLWKPTFGKYDKQPFGSYVFDDVLSSSIDGYQVVNKTFYGLYADHLMEYEPEQEDADDDADADETAPEARFEVRPLPLDRRQAILVTEMHIPMEEVDLSAMRNLLKQGNKIMLCLDRFPEILCDSLYFTQKSGSYFYSSIEQYARNEYRRDSLFFGTDSLHPEQVYAVFPHVHPACLEEGTVHLKWDGKLDSVVHPRLRCDSSAVLVRNKLGQAEAMRLSMDEGELFLVATPLMFTNYGLLDSCNASYAFRLLSYMEGLPLIRIEAYGSAHAESTSPLRYLLSRPPLQWALYMALCTLLLCMIFSARRRQWVIPVVHPPVNATLRFTQLIGNLYYQKKDYKDLLSKKYLYFRTEIKRLNGLDLQSGAPDKELNRRLAEKMGQTPRELWPAFRELKYLLREDSPVDEAAMIRCIDRMNEWMHYFT